jgi:hypothetical protein
MVGPSVPLSLPARLLLFKEHYSLAYATGFEPAFYLGWGIDYETCHLLRKSGAKVVIDDSMLISHAASETYRSGAAPETQQQFYDAALVEMRRRLANKYGMDWHQEFQKERF